MQKNESRTGDAGVVLLVMVLVLCMVLAALESQCAVAIPCLTKRPPYDRGMHLVTMVIIMNGIRYSLTCAMASNC